ncbi:class I SAM-dependent RNA methyltransferase [Sciscionella sediminilitoris]|uniref:class I SAM-dependent RNA methyltransferase n=1 Tax=Sciscionella sediminilitoris TaxID=1445613 RepID=UPI0004DF7B38|nr:TRAM domain-containing protein [Sciscionella sp. SE31]
MNRYALGDRVEATIESVAHGGHFVARVDGRVCFVRHALPGERVLAEVTEDRGKSFFRADAVAVLEAAPDRVTPPCPLAGSCGGCDFQHVSLARQRELKAEVVAEQLARLGGVRRSVEVEELPGGPRWRTRVRYAVDPEGRPGFRAHRSHTVIPVEDCPITVSECVEPVVGQRFSPRGEVAVAVDSRAAVTVTETAPARSGRRGRSRRVSGDGIAEQHVGGQVFRLAATDFWQVHPAAAATFSAAVTEYAAVGPADRVWDLYGGAGLFAAPLSAAGAEVIVVESAGSAVEHGRACLPAVTFRHGDVERTIDRLPAPDVVVLDPPRNGAGERALRGIAAARPDRIVYVACDPAALGRDTALLAGHGYELRELRAFDAFPMTHHVECVALFVR